MRTEKGAADREKPAPRRVNQLLIESMIEGNFP